ncbi:MAG: 4-(cytidine 5'-diphospho)-2-C-methyl-D-erythritol kinase [Alteromonadaceae bacterium]|uniref:4-(cytidine 5'-diphospho)-2-C-methyl-D-erythritol kinase n=1 Tax=Paraglaciecola chathamensis TaxID=368405 RepID=UPI000C6A3A1D|nr:4-(cytidine 5'-diphospho)-2-C-methyl-D-erythritol kinase [Paraglaciecola agarilytica]MBN25971.1 4-(cytidine 5'-diphospho)-2-C-methyl-D-erythritol kinase [Alteromonadaceae bacterium]|tara:strand:- start:8671 stop:9531 length:861 start_codon:yes stop_codon:yes gene_type:complete
MDQTIDWWPSPAKLNLFLHINGRYPNGYHKLQSLFQLLDKGDELAYSITPHSDIELLTPIEGVANEDNLIVKAARLLQAHTNCQQGCQIQLRKVLPMGGGIGGGSSNAATTLIALNYLWKCNLSLTELAKLGLVLGADVPVFVMGNTAFAQGVGEQLTPASLAQKHYLVVFPQCHVSTSEVFNAPELPRNTPVISWQEYDFDQTHNDCQQLVCNRFENVANTLRWLLEYAPSRMTGTGACLFAVFTSNQEAENVLANLPSGCSGFVAKGVDVSPVHDKLAHLDSIS